MSFTIKQDAPGMIEELCRSYRMDGIITAVRSQVLGQSKPAYPPFAIEE
ncbi:MAG TPA: hypothetical protein VIW25_15705 [Nitrososphaeraceae archaeon]